jgi:hypothetical protein
MLFAARHIGATGPHALCRQASAEKPEAKGRVCLPLVQFMRLVHANVRHSFHNN